MDGVDHSVNVVNGSRDVRNSFVGVGGYGTTGDAGRANCSIAFAAAWNRALITTEIITLSKDPFALLTWPQDTLMSLLTKASSLSVFSDSLGGFDASLAARSGNERRRTIWSS
jgi:hypothetical protein